MKIMKPEHVKAILVHCAATTATMDIGFKEIDRWHRKRGWMMCGYHYIIKREGMVEKGRELTRFGAHCPGGWNQKSIGICMVGGVKRVRMPGKRKTKLVPETNFTKAQYISLKSLLDYLNYIGYAHCEVLGHRDTLPGSRSKKDCPSFDVRLWLKSEGKEYGSAFRRKDGNEGSF